METLVQLQSSGRLIGMISHVTELKTRISAHLEVTRGDEGSTAKFVIKLAIHLQNVILLKEDNSYKNILYLHKEVL